MPRRGDAQVIGFEDAEVVKEPLALGGGNFTTQVRWFNPRETIDYNNADELLPAYEEALRTEYIDGTTRLYWADDAELHAYARNVAGYRTREISQLERRAKSSVGRSFARCPISSIGAG